HRTASRLEFGAAGLERIQPASGVVGQLGGGLQALEHLRRDHLAHALEWHPLGGQCAGQILQLRHIDCTCAMTAPSAMPTSTSSRILSTPDLGASISNWAFSDMISATRSPAATAAPSLTSQEVITASSSPSRRSSAITMGVELL